MTIAAVKKNLSNIDYDWHKASTYLVCIPLVSLYLQKIQLANILPLIPMEIPPSHINDQAVAKSKRFANICKWHLRGSLIQIIALTILTVHLSPLFSLLVIPASFEVFYIMRNCRRNKDCIYQTDGSGVRISSALTIF